VVFSRNNQDVFHLRKMENIFQPWTPSLSRPHAPRAEFRLALPSLTYPYIDTDSLMFKAVDLNRVAVARLIDDVMSHNPRICDVALGPTLDPAFQINPILLKCCTRTPALVPSAMPLHAIGGKYAPRCEYTMP